MTEQPTTDILIIGAGLAGLLVAADLQASGFQPLVVDKGRGVGGRLSSRRIGSATFDHGAQFITARTARFQIGSLGVPFLGFLERVVKQTGIKSAPHK